MISPEKLRRYPFFGFLTDKEFDKVATVAEQVEWETGEAIFGIGDDAKWLFFLEEGYIDLHYSVMDEIDNTLRKDFYIGEINPGEPFGHSSMLGARIYTATAVATKPSTGMRIEAKKLLALVEEDSALGAKMMQQVARAIFERLDHVRVQWAAASN
ncbi:MAG: Crp/Fnr family transcriptional regulator [Chloroflexi bacterium]|nr:MAG: Crp/Fnr family transcriptional regulator [Chloroflexota bacterium]MBL1197197.1 Crp/Fnr family transcriptional regulator [Chloroflexota bacterium]NOH14491.1 Crp/Fnr family transcriptional regulator [Chloroflexota bacterium]